MAVSKAIGAEEGGRCGGDETEEDEVEVIWGDFSE